MFTKADIFWLVIITIAFIIMYYRKVFFIGKKEHVSKSEIDILDLKMNGIRLAVDLEKLKISKTRKSFHQEIVNDTSLGILSEFITTDDEAYNTVESNSNEIKFKIPYGNSFIRFTKTIDMDPTTLLLHFSVQKETYLYVDPKNKRHYYLDLEFLNKE